MPLGDIVSLSFMSVYSVLQPLTLHCSLPDVYCIAFLSTTHNCLMKGQCICANFSFRLEKTESKMHKILTIAFANSAVVRTWVFECLSQFRHGEILLKACKHSGHPSTGHTNKNLENVYKIFDRDQGKYCFGVSCQISPLVWYMPENSSGGLGCVVDVCEVCA